MQVKSGEKAMVGCKQLLLVVVLFSLRVDRGLSQLTGDNVEYRPGAFIQGCCVDTSIPCSYRAFAGGLLQFLFFFVYNVCMHNC